MIRMLQGSSPQLMTSGGGGSGEGLSFLLGAGHWKLDYVPVSEYTTQIGFFFFAGVGRGLKVWGWGRPGRTGK